MLSQRSTTTLDDILNSATFNGIDREPAGVLFSPQSISTYIQ